MESLISTRFANLEDLDFIYDALVELFTEACVIERFSQTKTSLSHILFSPQPAAEVLIAEIKHESAGFALFSMTNRNFPLFDAPGIYLHDLYVKKPFRRKGIATELINQLNTIAKIRQCTRIDWVLLKNNEAGHNFYKSIESAKPVEYIQYMRMEWKEVS